MAIHSSTSAQLWNYSGKLILSVRMLLNTSSYRSCNLTVFELCHCILCRLVFDRCESRCRVQGKPGSRLVVAENNVSLIPLPSQLDVYQCFTLKKAYSLNIWLVDKIGSIVLTVYQLYLSSPWKQRAFLKFRVSSWLLL